MPSHPSAEPPGPPDRGVRAAPDDDGDRRGRGGEDERLVEVEERAVEGDRAPGQELAHDGEAFVHPRAAGRRVHPADRYLVAVLAAHPDPEDEPPGGEPRDVGELAGHQDGMTQRQQVHAAVDGQRGVEHRQRGGLDEPVEPQAGEEAHMVAAARHGRCPPRRPAPGTLPRLLGPGRAGRMGGACPPGAMPAPGSPLPPGPWPGRSLPCCSCRVLSLAGCAAPGPGPEGGQERRHAALVGTVGLAEGRAGRHAPRT